MLAKRGRVLWRTNPWFRVVRYGFCPDEAAWEGERKNALADAHLQIGPYPSDAGLTTSWKASNGDAHALVTLADWLDDEPIQLVSTIAHECVHVAAVVTDCMKDDCPSEEFQAYLVGGLVAQIFRDYSDARKRA